MVSALDTVIVCIKALLANALIPIGVLSITPVRKVLSHTDKNIPVSLQSLMSTPVQLPLLRDKRIPVLKSRSVIFAHLIVE